MDKFITIFDEIICGAESSKVNDRKANIQKLIELLENSEVLQIIDENTDENKSGKMNWPYIINAIHKFLLIEAERCSLKEKTVVTMKYFESKSQIILKAIRIVNRNGDSFLNRLNLVPIILKVLSSDIYSYYHKTYMLVLITYVLPIKACRVDLQPEQWVDLLRLSIRFYEDKNFTLSKINTLNCIQMIVHYGCLQSYLLFKVKKMLPFLENVFSDVALNQDLLTKPACKLAYTVCAAIATESRFAICKFSEKIIPCIISLNNSIETYELLLLLMQIHHPKGAVIDEDIAYANDWNKWKIILQTMYTAIMRDCKSEKLSEAFILLASEVLNQVLKVPEYSVDLKVDENNLYSQPTKKRRINSKLEKPVDLIKNKKIEQVWPMAQILVILFSKYPDCLKINEYTDFIETIIDILLQSNTSEHEHIMDSIYELLSVIINIEEQFIVSSEFGRNIDLHWNKIWDILIRSLSINQSERSGHKLAQSLMYNNKIRNLDSLIKLYISQTIKWSPNSLRTLMIYCESTSLSNSISKFNMNENSSTDNTDSMKKILINWLLNPNWQKITNKGILEDFCNTLLGITLKSECKDKSKDTLFTSCNCHELYCSKLQKLMPDDESLLIKNIENCYESLILNNNMCVTSEEVNIENNNDEVTNTFYDTEILQYLQESILSIISEIHTTDVTTTIIKLVFAAKFMTIIKDLKINSLNKEVEFIQTFSISLKNAYALLIKIDPLKITYLKLVQLTKAFIMLYGTSYSKEISSVIVCLTTKSILSKIIDWINFESNSTDSSDDVLTNKKYIDFDKECQFSNNITNTVRLQTLIALIYFCHIKIEEKHENQINLMKQFFEVEKYDKYSAVDLRMVMIVLLSITDYSPEEIHKHYGDTPLKFLIQLFKDFNNDDYYTRCILNIIPRLYSYAKMCNVDILVNSIVSLIEKKKQDKKYGPLVYVEYLKCLLNIIEIDNTFIQSMWFSKYTNETTPMLLTIFSYFKQPFFLIQIEVAKCFQRLFILQSINNEMKIKMFKTIREIISQSLEPEENSGLDEIYTRKISILLVLTYIICSNGIFQNRALFILLQVITSVKIDVKVTQKLFRTIKKYINNAYFLQDNANYLLNRWLNSTYSLNLFPWMLFDCESEEKFYKSYINNVVTVKIMNLDLTGAMTSCENINANFIDVFENAFPQILPWLLQAIMKENITDLNKKDTISTMFENLTTNRAEFATIKNFQTLLNSKFDEIIVNIMKKLHDERHFNEIFGRYIIFPTAEPPPYYSINNINKCLTFIEQNSFERNRSLQYTLSNICPNVLQKILLNLTDNIYKMKFIEYRLKAFHQYSYFCTIIIEDISKDYFNSIYKYLIKDISYTLLHIMRENDELLSEAASIYFKKFLGLTLPTRSSEIKKLLNYYVTTMIAIICDKKATSRQSIILEILEFLIIEQKDLMSDAIGKLNTFCNIEKFQNIQKVCNEHKYKKKTYNLQEEIQHFLYATNDKDVYCSPDAIMHLQNQLSNNKAALYKIYDKLQSTCYINDESTQSIIHQLLYKLVKLIKSSNIDVSTAAAKCLGELGPTDLMTMILYPKNRYVKENKELAIDILSYKLLRILSQFIISSDIKLRKESVNALFSFSSSSLTKKLLREKTFNDVKKLMNDSDSLLSLDYIRPFIGESLRIETINIDFIKFKECMSIRNSIWTTKSNESYSKWITSITSSVVDCFSGFYLEQFIPICKLSVKFCELLLPRIIGLIISLDNSLLPIVCNCINTFFDYHFQPMINMNQNSQNIQRMSVSSCDREIVNCMLDITNFIRIQIKDQQLLELNFMSIVRGAQYCSAYFTALYYAELKCEQLTQQSHGDFITNTKIDYILEKYPDQGLLLQNIFKEAYLKIGDPDAIHGCGSLDLKDPSSLIQYYIHTRKWDKVALMQDIELDFRNTLASKEMTNALRKCGLHYLLSHFLSGTTKKSEKLCDFEYECSWRLSNWDIISTQSLKHHNNVYNETESEYEFYVEHYRALKCFYERNNSGVKQAVENARLSVIKTLRSVSLESSKTMYEKLTQLQMLQELEELNSTNPQNYVEIFKKWKENDITNSNEFEYIEPILTQRTVMLKIHAKQNIPFLQHTLAKTYKDIANVASNQGYSQIATLALGTLRKLENLSENIQNEIEYQNCLLLWNQNDHDISSTLLKKLMNKQTIEPKLLAKIFRTYGDWMMETKFENPEVIQKYYENSINITNSIEDVTMESEKNLYDTQVALAQFADLQYQQISTYMQSSSFESFKKCIEYSRNVELGSWLGTSKDKDVHDAVTKSQKQTKNDVAELKNILKEQNKYLILALKYYLKILQNSNDYNLLIFRLIALWLNNINDEGVNKILKDNLNRIPSFKFITLIPQLAAHISDKNDLFSLIIFQLLERCSIEHPHHTLPVLLALVNLYDDYKYFDSSKKPPKKEEPRILGSKKLINFLSSSDTGGIIKEMNELSRSLVMLANYKSDEQMRNVYQIPRNQQILKISNMEKTFVSTIPVRVNPSANYKNIIGIYKYESRYESVGGKSAPKKVTCIGTDGNRYTQLVKGVDDLRQDAVMQQVFGVMNTLLQTCKETKHRQLRIRTYKVVPLTQRSGVIQWCDNTIPIVRVLIGPDTLSGLHRKYYPDDYTSRDCRKKMEAVVKASNENKLKVFLECCKRMQPAFHHFFLEKYPSPEIWFKRRLTYTRSVATTSIAGYILGLGDRHLNNILIDETTAEVIHIDLGIAFEQGKILLIPETVPFRLTRDIVAPMGVSGVEGTMKRCCEETMTVLRDQRQIIITLLQVLQYDPLFAWDITPAKAYSVQSKQLKTPTEDNEIADKTNKIAQRALLRIEQKLQGVEEGIATSVSGQVTRLIREAQDPSNLCRLYVGWRPFL